MKDLKNPNKLYVSSNDFVANLNSIYNASLTATAELAAAKLHDVSQSIDDNSPTGMP